MARLAKTLEIRTSPHILSGYSVDTIMFNVVLALLPTTLFALWAFGLAGGLTLAGLTVMLVWLGVLPSPLLEIIRNMIINP